MPSGSRGASRPIGLTRRFRKKSVICTIASTTAASWRRPPERSRAGSRFPATRGEGTGEENFEFQISNEELRTQEDGERFSEFLIRNSKFLIYGWGRGDTRSRALLTMPGDSRPESTSREWSLSAAPDPTT